MLHSRYIDVVRDPESSQEEWIEVWEGLLPKQDKPLKECIDSNGNYKGNSVLCAVLFGGTYCDD
jgi:hypothetical protein